MISHINGKLVEVSPTYAVVECAGVGYLVNISLTTYGGIAESENVMLYTYPVYKEDSHTLYGFADKQEREIFSRLISVSGVGGNTARIILSSLSSSEVVNAIASEDVSLLKSIKGIGAKTAQRIIVDLKDKVAGIEMDGVATAVSGGVKAEAVSALEVLGYNPRQSEKIVLKITQDMPSAGLEEVIKEALKRL